MMQLRFLRVERIDLSSYQAILSTCPNLYFLRFHPQYFVEKSSIRNSHGNLRQMILDLDSFVCPLQDYDLDDYLSCVPNLEQLSIYRKKEDILLSLYLDYNWQAASIERYLPLLRQFRYHLHIYSSKEWLDSNSEQIRSCLEADFQRKHSNRYQSKLHFKLCSYSIAH